MIVNRKKYWPYILVGAVSLVVITVLITIRFERGLDDQYGQNPVLGARFEADDPGLALDYQSDIWRRVTLTGEEKDLGYNAIYQAVVDGGVPLEMSIRRQADVRRAAQLTNRQPLDVILFGIRKTSQVQYENFVEKNHVQTTIAGRPAFELDFDYTRQSEDRSFQLRQKVVAVLEDSDAVWVVTFQTLASNFTQQYEVNFKPIIESMTFE